LTTPRIRTTAAAATRMIATPNTTAMRPCFCESFTEFLPSSRRGTADGARRHRKRVTPVVSGHELEGAKASCRLRILTFLRRSFACAKVRSMGGRRTSLGPLEFLVTMFGLLGGAVCRR
jgi:hypothetical protein